MSMKYGFSTLAAPLGDAASLSGAVRISSVSPSLAISNSFVSPSSSAAGFCGFAEEAASAGLSGGAASVATTGPWGVRGLTVRFGRRTALQDVDLAPEQFETILMLVADQGIEILEGDETTATDDAGAAGALVLGRRIATPSTDPVRMYLREIGRVPLLTQMPHAATST